jgi:hypothetical protein
MRPMGWMLAALLLALVGCDKKPKGEAAVDIEGETSKPGMALAYEHTVAIALPQGQLHERMRAVREACLAGTQGACSLLRFDERAGSSPSGSVQVRIAPAGVEAMVREAAAGGELGWRSTRAEDLAPQVEDNEAPRTRLQRQRETLGALPEKAELSLAEHVALSAELAKIDTQLAAFEQEADNLARRVETNLLTLDFACEGEDSSWAGIRAAFADAPGAFAEGIAEAIGWIAMLLPIAIAVFPFALPWRASWRRLTRSRGPG